jgi:Sec-independent protein translocase protein TatA
MPDTLVVLIIVLIVVLIWRGPKTLPGIGAMFGRGVKNAREEASKLKSNDGQTPPDDRPAA